MKIAYFGCDLFMQCLDVLQSHDHDITAIFAAEDPDNNEYICAYARKNEIPYFTGRPDKQQILKLERDGVECLFSIEYDSLIPLPSSRVMTINVHPTMLPHGGGQRL